MRYIVYINVGNLPTDKTKSFVERYEIDYKLREVLGENNYLVVTTRTNGDKVEQIVGDNNRFIFNIPVGNLPSERAIEYVAELEENMRENPFFRKNEKIICIMQRNDTMDVQVIRDEDEVDLISVSCSVGHFEYQKILKIVADTKKKFLPFMKPDEKILVMPNRETSTNTVDVFYKIKNTL